MHILHLYLLLKYFQVLILEHSLTKHRLATHALCNWQSDLQHSQNTDNNDFISH